MAAKILTDTEIRNGVSKAFARFNPERIILFGSHSQGSADEERTLTDSVHETEKKFLDRLRELYMAWDLPNAVDILAYTPQEFEELNETRAFIQDAVSTGKVLYERD
jgi:hypothetical protein